MPISNIQLLRQGGWDVVAPRKNIDANNVVGRIRFLSEWDQMTIERLGFDVSLPGSTHLHTITTRDN